MTTIPSFTHHQLPLLQLGGKTGSKASKAMHQEVERIKGSLNLGRRIEVALVHPEPDFLDIGPGMAAARKAAFKTMCQMKRLRCVVLTAKPENIHDVIKEGLFGSCPENLCVGLVADRVDGLEEKLEALRRVPCHKMLLLHSLEQVPDLLGKLGSLDWVVLATPAMNAGWAEPVKAVCHANNVAFLHLDQDSPSGFHTCVEGEATSDLENEPARPEHPFGPEVLLRRPAMKGHEGPTQLTLNLSCPETHVAEQACPTTVAAVTDTTASATGEATAPSEPEEVTVEPPTATAMHGDVSHVENAEVTSELAAASGDMSEGETAPNKLDACSSGTLQASEAIGDGVVQPEPADPDPIPAVATSTVIDVPKGKRPRAINKPASSPITAEVKMPGGQRMPCDVASANKNDVDLADFRRLEKIVVKGVEAGLEAGAALMEIRDRKLWKAAGYRSWNQYCEEVRGLTRQYVNDQIKAADTRAKILQVERILSTSTGCVPTNVAQLKELYPLKDPEKQAQACIRAAEREQGRVTAKSLSYAVAEMMAEEDNTPQVRPPDRKARLALGFEQMRDAITAGESQDTLLSLLAEIEKLAR